MHGSAQTIRENFTTLRRSVKARHRNIAEQLRISEGELIAAHVGATNNAPNAILNATRLRPDWPNIMASLGLLGEVMALTRNTSCVHEKMGIYRNVSHQNHVGFVLGGDIDLRVFYRQWAHGFGAVEQTAQGAQHSLQFFDAEGTAIHKIFLKQHSNVSAYVSSSVRSYPPSQLAALQSA